MKISIDNALGVMPHALSLRSQRTSVLANNIANADTPGFKARDIDFRTALQQRTQAADAQASAPMRTHPDHLHITNHSSRAELQYRNPLMPALDGNSVDTQLEQAAFAENSTQFLTTLRMLNGRITGLMSAIKGE